MKCDVVLMIDFYSYAVHKWGVTEVDTAWMFNSSFLKNVLQSN